ncbi:aspartate/glutamate racemase family protein [Celeribacter litoreus]|uniref:aspartate/glutamate racemase family protein n=1 Tax=Celeribacter litoreus TaxID=2876714 RepID=UPI001CCA8950|nr:aspartate/glutamate racemase family protein [Celeribacter litoreus]MCA0044276.1 aspartate/glutamate racemase family protein [Celeribacter litoreus]
MKIAFLNPNSTAQMTESVVETARHVLPDAEIIGWTNTSGPPAIQGPEDGDAALPGLRSFLPKAADEDIDVLVIACFDDTGLEELRATASCPVIGIGQSAYVMAQLKGQSYGVVTTMPDSVPVIEDNITRLGFQAGCLGVKPSGIPVLEVEEGSPETLAHLSDEIAAMTDRGAHAIILGCAGMSAHHAALSEKSAVPLIDGVRAAAALAQALLLS